MSPTGCTSGLPRWAPASTASRCVMPTASWPTSALLIVGLGDIGGRLARLAKAFDMRVIGLRRDPALGHGAADAVHRMAELGALLPEADVVALTCPLTADTENLIDGAALARMKPSA